MQSLRDNTKQAGVGGTVGCCCRENIVMRHLGSTSSCGKQIRLEPGWLRRVIKVYWTNPPSVKSFCHTSFLLNDLVPMSATWWVVSTHFRAISSEAKTPNNQDKGIRCVRLTWRNCRPLPFLTIVMVASRTSKTKGGKMVPLLRGDCSHSEPEVSIRD